MPNSFPWFTQLFGFPTNALHHQHPWQRHVKGKSCLSIVRKVVLPSPVPSKRFQGSYLPLTLGVGCVVAGGFENGWARWHFMEIGINLYGDRIKYLLVTSFFPVLSNSQNHKAINHGGFFGNKVLSHFLPSLFFSSSRKRTLILAHHCQRWRFPYSTLCVWEDSVPLGPSFLHTGISQDAPYSENPRPVSSSSPGQWLAMPQPSPCKSSLNGRSLKPSSSWNCKVSPVSQPIMTPSEAIAGPLMYFGPCPLLYLAKLWESTV